MLKERFKEQMLELSKKKENDDGIEYLPRQSGSIGWLIKHKHLCQKDLEFCQRHYKVIEEGMDEGAPEEA